MGTPQEWAKSHRPSIQGRMTPPEVVLPEKCNFRWKEFPHLPIEPQQVGKNALSGDRQGNRS
jgi:hypothetical protein